MKRKYKIVLLSVFSLIILTLFVGISYSFRGEKNYYDKDASLVYTDEYLSINYLDGKYFDIKNFKSGEIYNKKISISNVSDRDLFVTISFMDVEKSSDDLELIILDNENNSVYDKKISNIDTEVVKSVSLPVSKTVSYNIMVKNNGKDMAYFSANILAYRDSSKESSSNFRDTILANNEIKTAKTEIGKESALENEGLIESVDNDGKTYYFRGAVDNNYVSFANFTWRIVRINGNDSVRLILDSTMDDQIAFNNDSSETDNYSSKLEFSNSNLKDELESWMNNNLSEYSKYIMESSFCEDTSVFNEENNISYLNTYNRIFVDNIPGLTCMGKIVKSKIGVLTADEIVFAGASSNSSNNRYYLFNNSITSSWWTLSGSQIIPSNNSVDAISVNRDGSLSYDKKISNQMYIRPVISLDINSVVTGSGSASDPYVVKTK